MATLLMKPVTRQMMGRDRFNRSVLVTIEPPDVITFRVKGKRFRVETSLHHCYVLAQMIHANMRYQEKLKDYKAKKKAGQRAVRPKQPAMVFNKIYSEAIMEAQKQERKERVA